MRYIKRVLAIAACLCLILSFSVLPASAFDEVQDKYIFELEGFPYHDNGNDANNYFANGVFISDASSGFQAYYYEFVFNSDNLFGSRILFNSVSLFYKSDTYPYLILPSYNKSGSSSFTVPEAVYIYDVNGNLVYNYQNPLSFTGSKTGDFYPYNFSMSFLSTNGMFLSLGETFHNNLVVDTVVKGNNGFPSNTLTAREALIMYPEIIINGYSYNGSKAGVTLTAKGDVEPVTDENGNITNYIINNEIDISPLTESDEDPRNPHSLNSSELDELEAGLMSEDVTIPEFDSSLVDGSGTYWNMVEQLLDTSGLKPVVLFALAVGLASFIIGRKT